MMTDQTTDALVAFLQARLDEDEQTAKGLLNAARMLGREPDFYGAGGPAAQAYWQHFGTKRALGEVDAKRLIIEQHASVGIGPVCLSYCHTRAPGKPQTWPCLTLRMLALPYREHPDYRQEWAP